MPVNDGSNISIAGPRGGLTTTDPFQQASKLFSAMRRASGGSDGTNAAVAAALGLPPNAKIDYMLDPKTGAYVHVVGGTDELRKHNLEAAKQRRAIEVFNSDKAAGIREKLKGFGGMSAEKQASVLNDIRMNDIPKLSQDAQISGSDLITYGLADYNRMQKENAANVAKTGVGDILWDSLRVGARNFVDSVADIFSDSKEQLARADLRKQYIRDIQDNNAFLRNRALQQQEGAGFMDRFGWGELAATTGEFLAENAPVLAATALTGGAAGLAARGLGAAAATAGRASMLGSAVGGGLTGAPTQLGSAINEIAADNKLTEDQKLQALDEAYGPSLGAGAALGAVVMPFGQYISRGIGSGLARAGVGNSNVAKMVRSRRAGEALPTGTNNWDEAMAMARRNDILAENEAIANQRFYRGMLGRRLRDSAIEGSLLSGASQMATNAAVDNDLMENVGPATIGGAIGGALFTPFNRRTAMGVPDDVIGQRTAERQNLVQLLANRNAAMGGDARSLDDQTLGAMEAWDALAKARGADALSGANPMTPEQRDAYLRQQSYDDLLLNRMMAHEAAVRERDRLAAEAAQRAMYEPRLNARQNLLDDLSVLREQRNNAILGQEAADNSILNLVQAWDAAPSSLMDPRTRSYVRRTPELDAEWAANEDVLRQIQGLVPTDTRTSLVNTLAGIRNLRNDAILRQEAIDNAALNVMQAWDAAPSSLMDPRVPRYVRNTPELDAEWRDEAIRRINNIILNQGNLGNRLALPAALPFNAEGIALPVGTGRTTAGDAWVGPSLMDAVTSSQEAPTPYTYTRVMNNAELSALQQGREGVARTLGAIRDARQRQDAADDRLLSQLIAEENQRRAFEENRDARTSLVNTLAGGRNVRNDAILRQEAMDDRQLAQLEAEQAQRSLFEQNRAARSGLVNTLTGIRDSRDAAENQILDLMQAWGSTDPRVFDPRNRGYTRRTPDLDAEWAANEAVLRQIQEQVPAETRSSLLGTLRGVRNQRNDDILRQEFRNRGYTRRTPELDAEWAQRSAAQEQRRADSRERTAQQQRVVDTLAALRERRNNTELRNERLINTAIAQEYYFNRVRDQQFRRDFTVYEGEVLLENNPGVLPTNNYLPENVAAVVEHLGEPRTAETMLDGTPATDQRPKPQRPYTKAITYVSSDDALRKFTGKLRGRESMIPRDIREEQMGWMNDILAAGTGKGRISAQGVLAKDVRSTLDRIVDAQTVDSAMRLDELLLTRLRGSEDTSLFNRAQRAAMQYVRNRIYTTMDDYAYQNKLGRYGEINANNPENTDPTGGGGSPTSGMGRADTAGAEPLADVNLSNDSGRPTDTAGASKAIAGQLPVSPAGASPAVEERRDAGAKASGAGENQKVEGDSAAETAQQQTANGKRGAGNAARVDAAANQSAGGNRLEGSSEQGNDRDAADTGSNKQPGSRTEPEDGEPIDPSIEEDPSMYKVHTLDWPYKNLDEELEARDAENVKIGIDKKTKKKIITIDPLIGDDTGGRLAISDDLRVDTEASKDDPVYPIIVVTLQNARGKELTAAYRFANDDGAKRGAWVPADTIPEMGEDTVVKEIPGITIQGSTGKIQIDAPKLPSMAKDFESRVNIELFDDTMQSRNEVEFPFQPHDFDSSPNAETPREVLNGAYESKRDRGVLVNTTPTAHFPRESLEDPILYAATYNIDSSVGDNARVVLTLGDSRYPNVTYAHVVADANRSRHQLTSEQRIARLNDELRGIHSKDSDDIPAEDDDLPSFMESSSDGKSIDILLDNMPNSMQEAILRRGRFTVTGRVIDADGNDIVKPESATYFVHRDNDTAIQQAEELGYYNKPNEAPTADTTVAAERAPTVEPKGLSSAEEIAARQANPDRVPTEGVDPESNEALAWAAQQEGNRTHVEDDEFPAIDADFLLNDLKSSKNAIFWHEFALQGIEIEKSLAEKKKQLFAKMLEIMGEPDTPANEAAAQKVVEENGPVDIRETFVEDAAPANATITAKDSLKNNAKKRLQKAKQNIPQLTQLMTDTPAPTTDSPAVFSERFGRTIDDMEKQYARNNSPIDGFIRGAASSGASAKRIIAKRNASDASWKEDLRNDMADTAARIGIMRSTGLFGEIKRGSPLAKKEEFYKNNNIPLIAPNSGMARHLREYFGAMPARERKITQAIDYVLRDPTAQKFDIINDSTQGAC